MRRALRKPRPVCAEQVPLVPNDYDVGPSGKAPSRSEVLTLLLDMLDAAIRHIPKTDQSLEARRLRVGAPLMRLTVDQAERSKWPSEAK